MLDRQRTRREPDAVRVEDVIPPDLLDGVGDEDRDYLEQVFREPQKYLPPRSRRPVAAHRPEEQAEEPESRLARRAKLVGLVGAGALVAGAVVTASLLSGGPRPTTPVTAEESFPAGFSGAAALGGAVVPEQHRRSGGTTPGHRESTPSASGGDTTGTAGTTVTTPGTGGLTRESTGPSPSAPAEVESSTGGQSTSTDPATAGDKLAAVKKFYASIERSPSTALSLLTPVLAGGEAGSLVRAWSVMSAIDVQDLRVQDDGSVLAVAVLHQADGTLVRVTQQFDVTGHDVISAARVLSAVAFA
ncbi:hypothetical protein [Amycolatopsis sp. PS_44_ISF1]|uniref:hypothetical protein n=1 Tax=Amycolatopsis sp. PS_44_ISF1 TaxID=2974917 RepID=UPI0028E07F04|nr:hypothetical protein [Amycolatopsis sp. PS_44_ISF1]MDT8909638.1 hypothetical protein [Amycolatopsis sp. PS_44_ISF1]